MYISNPDWFAKMKDFLHVSSAIFSTKAVRLVHDHLIDLRRPCGLVSIVGAYLNVDAYKPCLPQCSQISLVNTARMMMVAVVVVFELLHHGNVKCHTLS